MSTRQLAAIMFTDMVGYTALMQQNEALAKQIRDRSKAIFDERLIKYHGKLLQNYGDGTLSIFSSALDAVKCAIEIQTLNLQSPKIEMRIGIHLGDVMFDDTGIYGDSVNVASRIESLATPGSIFISERLHEEIRNQSIEATPLGFFELKNVRQPMNVFAVSNPGIIVPSRSEVKGKVKQTLNSIAVLPFVHMSNQPDDEYFCDGISEEIINVLSRLEGLQVTSRTSSFAFKGKTEDIREIAAKLNVQKLLEGSVRKAGDKVRITAQLINAADGYHLWSETYDRSLEDIFAVQDEIAREIAHKFRINLTESEHAMELVKAPTENMDAYKKYLEGIFLWNTQLPGNVQPAIDALRQAITLDTSFTAPYSYLAFIYFVLFYSGTLPQTEAVRLLKEASDGALSRDPDGDQSLLAHGIYCAASYDWKGCGDALKRSIDKNPNSTLALISLASYHGLTLQKSSALAFLEKARTIDPIGPFTIGNLVELYATYGKYDEAIALADDFLSFNPENPYVHLYRQMAYGFKGNWKEVIEWLEEIRSTYGDLPHEIAMLGIAYCRTSEFKKAEALIDLLKEQEKAQPGLILDQIGLLYGNMLRKKEFFERVKIGFENGTLGMFWYYKTSFYPDEINNDEQFKEWRKKIGLPV